MAATNTNSLDDLDMIASQLANDLGTSNNSDPRPISQSRRESSPIENEQSTSSNDETDIIGLDEDLPFDPNSVSQELDPGSSSENSSDLDDLDILDGEDLSNQTELFTGENLEGELKLSDAEPIVQHLEEISSDLTSGLVEDLGPESTTSPLPELPTETPRRRRRRATGTDSEATEAPVTEIATSGTSVMEVASEPVVIDLSDDNPGLGNIVLKTIDSESVGTQFLRQIKALRDKNISDLLPLTQRDLEVFRLGFLYAQRDGDVDVIDLYPFEP